MPVTISSAAAVVTHDLIGLGGNDLLFGATGANAMQGGAGDDRYVAEYVVRRVAILLLKKT